jgi:ATP-dependent exoDNAse (exonuclease V) beta subunit
LVQGETPDKILATTFTRKAAGEIRDRIFSRLAKAALSDESALELGSEVGKPTLSKTEAATLLKRLADHQHRLLITTLDALFISMAQAFSLELGLPVNWRIASEENIAKLRDTVLRELLRADGKDKIQDILALLHDGKVKRSVYRDLIDAVQRLYPYFLATEVSAWEWIPSTSVDGELSYEEIVHTLESYDIPLNKSGTPNANIAKLVRKLVTIAETRDWKAFSRSKVTENALNGNYDYYRKPLDPPIIKALDALFTHARHEISMRYKKRLKGVRELLAVYDAAYRSLQSRAGFLTFDDVKHYLSNGSVTGELEHLYYRLDSRICHLLLDEFQDTSINEWKIVEPIADEVLSRPEERTFFCVGDMKQAIYGWRGGVAEIFGSIETRWQHLLPESKDVTYRCAPAVVDFVNDVFSSLANLKCVGDVVYPVQAWLGRFETHEAARKTLSGRVTIEQAQSEQSTVECAVDSVFRLHTEFPDATIGVLVRTNKVVSHILARFSETHPDLLVSEEGAVRITDSALVRAILSLLHAIDHPSDTLSVFHVRDSGLAGALEIPVIEGQLEAEWRSAMYRELLSDGYGAVLNRWCDALAPIADDLDAQRLEQLVEQAYLFDEQRTPRIVDFVQRIEKIAVELPVQAPIRVMSLHKSKGLEFDIVVLPDLSYAPVVKSDEVLVEQESPISRIEKLVSGSGNKFDRALIPQLGELWRAKRNSLTTEVLSLFYVSVTRARQVLHLVLPSEDSRPSTPNASPAEMLFERYGDKIADGLLFGDARVEFDVNNGEEEVVEVKSPKSFEIIETRSTKQKPPRLERISPSKLTSSRQLTDPRISAQASYARDRGSALHLLFESIEWLEDYSIEAVTSDHVLGALESSRLQKVLDEFQDLLRAPVIIEELSRERFSKNERVELWRERAFAIEHEGQLVSGIIDRVVIVYDGVKPISAEITDFKSDSLHKEGAIDERLERYKPQMAMYARAICGLLGREIPVVSKILFLDGPEIRQYPTYNNALNG